MSELLFDFAKQLNPSLFPQMDVIIFSYICDSRAVKFKEKYLVRKSSTLFGGLVFAAFLSSQSLAQPSVVSKNIAPASKETIASKKPNTATIEKIESDVSEALTVIQDNYIEGKKVDYNELFKSSIEGMLRSLDPHSNYFDAKDFEQFRTEQQSQYFGIGASIGNLTDKDDKVIATYIRGTFEGAPAQRAGLRYGDKIVDVNGTSMLGKTFTEVRTFLLGPRGTPAKITVERYSTGKRETVDIIRDAVPQPSIPDAYMIRPGIGYIGMTSRFNQTTYNEFRAAMQKLKAEGMQQLVLDIRENGGGLVNQAYRIANTFLSKGQTVFTQKGRLDGTGDTYKSDNAAPETMPMVLMVNGRSASASEILAGALQDHDRALVVGENTFGKGLVQNPFQMEYGTMLLLTIAKYETPSGRLIQRDYSDGSLYSYYGGGSLSEEEKAKKPTGAESKTDTGRLVYSGGGILPDEIVKPTTIPTERFNVQQKLVNSAIFNFALDVASSRIPGFDAYKIDNQIAFDHDIKSTDYPNSEALFQAFKKYATEKYNYTGAQIDKEREFVDRALRTEFVTAAYGTQTSTQIFNNDYDTQLKKAIELLPKAKQLASAKTNVQKTGLNSNR